MTGTFSAKVSVCLDFAKVFIADKLGVDLNDEEVAKKAKIFIVMGAIVGITALLYGRRALGERAVLEGEEPKNEKLEAFMSQLRSTMEKLLPTAFSGISTYLVTKNVLTSEEEETEKSDTPAEDEE